MFHCSALQVLCLPTLVNPWLQGAHPPSAQLMLPSSHAPTSVAHTRAKDPCGAVQYYCPGNGLREHVDEGFYSTPLRAPTSERGSQVTCDIGYSCSGNGERILCRNGTFSPATGAVNCTWAAITKFSNDPKFEQPCGPSVVLLPARAPARTRPRTPRQPFTRRAS